MTHETDITGVLKADAGSLLVDVRSPNEFVKGHIPGALHIPVFDDEERAQVGIRYKKAGRSKATDLAMELVRPKQQDLLEQVQKLAKTGKVTLYCWRGGMRSAKFAQFLSENGLEVDLIKGGYKSYRNLIYNSFKLPWKLVVVGGMTGTGKTDILVELKTRKCQVLDMEGLANHKGSTFGALGQANQPSTEQFQNNIWEIWQHFDITKPIFVEDESQAIGTVRIPDRLFDLMRNSPVINLEISLDIRAERLVREYGSFDKKLLKEKIESIRKRLGGQVVKNAIEMLIEDDLHGVALLMLKYYDKAYNYGLSQRSSETVCQLKLQKDDPEENAKLILNHLEKNNIYYEGDQAYTI